jgi:hypothetical protein
MWQIKYVAGENFMSFEKAEFAFENKCYVVRGLNLDNDGQQSNGGGKTSFADIAAVALFGYSLTGRNVKDCVQWNVDAKCLVVQLFMENLEHNLNCYIVRRIYSGGKGQELSIFVNDVVPKSLPSKKGVENGVDVREGNAYILKEILDITEDDLLNYYFISRKNYKPFLEVNTDRKLEVISRFSRADVVDKVIVKLEENVKEVDADLTHAKNSILKLEGNIEALHQMLLQPARDEFELGKLTEISNIENTLLTKLDEYERFSAEIIDLEAAIAEAEFEPVDYSAKLQKLQEKQKATDAVKNKHIKDSNNLNQSMNKKQALMKNAITCPQCSHQFNIHGEAIPTAADIDNIKKELESIQTLIDKVTKDKADNDQALLDISNMKSKQDGLLFELEGEKRRLKHLQRSNEDLLKQMQNLEIALTKAQAKSFDEQESAVQAQINDKELQLQQLDINCQGLHDENTNIKKWIEIFNDFKFELGNKPLENICVLVNQYLKMNGSDLNLLIEGFKKIRSGEIRQALNPVVYRNWMNPQPLVQFSEGERARLNLTVDLAFQQLINSTSKYGGLDYYQNDELLSPLDSLGVSNAAQAFNNLNKTIMLVSHSGADMMYDNTILIKKENKVSVVS